MLYIISQFWPITDVSVCMYTDVCASIFFETEVVEKDS